MQVREQVAIHEGSAIDARSPFPYIRPEFSEKIIFRVYCYDPQDKLRREQGCIAVGVTPSR